MTKAAKGYELAVRQRDNAWYAYIQPNGDDGKTILIGMVHMPIITERAAYNAEKRKAQFTKLMQDYAADLTDGRAVYDAGT